MQSTTHNKYQSGGNAWYLFSPLIEILKAPLRAFGLLDTLSVRPVKRLEWLLHAGLILFFISAVIIPAIAGNIEMKHFIPALFAFLGYTIITIVSELEWHRVNKTIGKNIYSISDAIDSKSKSVDELDDAMALSSKNEIEVFNDPYKLHPTAIDLVIQFGIFFAAVIVKIGGVKVHNHDFGSASQWYKSLWREITLEMESRSAQVFYAITRSYEAVVIVIHDGLISRAIKFFSGHKETDKCDCGSENCPHNKNK